MEDNYHIPVLLQSCINALNLKPGGIYIDATFGGGGHAKEILKKLKGGKLYAFDSDADTNRNALQDERFNLIHQNYRFMQKFLRMYGVMQVDGIVADLGVSTYQFDEASRGFSMRTDAQLDMRMDQTQKITAAHIIKKYSVAHLQEMFSRNAEVRNAKQLSVAIEKARKLAELKTTKQLVRVAEEVIKGERHRYIAQVFQALRIEVNDEINALKEMLQSTIQILKPGGMLVVISYHSLEDRLVKNIMKTGDVNGIEKKDVKGNAYKPYIMITKKPVTPSDDEQKENSRSRSAKMRVAQKTYL